MKLDEYLLNALFFNFIIIGTLLGISLISISYFNLATWLIFVFTALIGTSWLLAHNANEPFAKSTKSIQHLLRENLHELNMPLSTIEANVSMLKKSIKDEKDIKRLDRIELASSILQEKYEEVEYGLKAEFGNIENERFCVAKLAQERIDRFKKLFEKYSFKTSLQTLIIYADKRGFAKVIDNLLSNAIKYSSKNSTISVKTEDSKLIISDNGTGMDEFELLNIYKRYYQADVKKDGMGLGLTLVKEYCDRAKITIHISSKKGSGTTVMLNLENVKEV